MAVTVNDILHIDKMTDAVVAAGAQGLNKTVRRIATIENLLSIIRIIVMKL